MTRAASSCGTANAYKRGCRCDACRAANTAYVREQRRAGAVRRINYRGKEPPTHGKSGYTNFGCLCDICWSAYSARAKRRYREQKDYINAAKAKPCADCGVEYPPIVMDFDHVRGNKSFNLSSATMRPRDVIDAEIAKCEVVCSNCHRLRTAARGIRGKQRSRA